MFPEHPIHLSREMRVMNDGQAPGERPTVVIIDDDIALRVMVRESLEQSGSSSRRPWVSRAWP